MPTFRWGPDYLWSRMQWRHKVAWGVVIVWAVALVGVRWGARFECLRPLPIVIERDHCQIDRPPTPGETLTMVHAGDTLISRNTDRIGDTLCLQVELADGRVGYLPWHDTYLREDGYTVSWGW